MNKQQIWINAIEEYCQTYNIPIKYLAETLKDPKVIPMIRGKAFEFSVILKLESILSNSKSKIEKPFLNPQLGSHDRDVLLTHIRTGKQISIECKLSAKGSFKKTKSDYQIKVKCMRSRTLGAEQVKRLAIQRGVTEEQLAIHNDQYLPSDFDIVITSIGNAFYETDTNGIFVWQPEKEAEDFLNLIKSENTLSLKDFTFFSMYVAKSQDLAISNNDVLCTRKKCTEKTSCGFIPNYPVIHFLPNELIPVLPWIPIENSEGVFLDIIGEAE